VLFIGIDASEDRSKDHRLSDTILIASFDPAEGRVEMVSMPRDIARFPLFDRPATEFHGKINELMAYADEHPERYPQGGIATLISQVEYLVGVDIDYYASVEIPGFRDLIDAVGGVDIVNERLIDDPEFQWDDGRVGYRLEPGPYHLDGTNALAYVRSRKGIGNTDFQRARRQQEVILALRQKLDDPAVLARLPAILDVAARTVRTNVPTEELPALMDLARQSGDARIKSVVLGPTTYASLIPASEIGGLYALRLDLDAVADLSVRIWGPQSRYWDPSAPLPSQSPVPVPGESPVPLPSQSPAPSRSP
jgi:LCP family protein required for cell wall assembly